MHRLGVSNRGITEEFSNNPAPGGFQGYTALLSDDGYFLMQGMFMDGKPVGT